MAKYKKKNPKFIVGINIIVYVLCNFIEGKNQYAVFNFKNRH